MKKFEVGIIGLVITVLVLINPPFEYVIGGLILLIVTLVTIKDEPEKVYTNREIATLGELIGIDGSCNCSITYLFKYKDKNYLLTYVGDLELMYPDKQAFEI